MERLKEKARLVKNANDERSLHLKPCIWMQIWSKSDEKIRKLPMFEEFNNAFMSTAILNINEALWHHEALIEYAKSE